MPQKVNPDVLELMRGKTARVVGNLTRLLVLIKGLPLAYNRDLQEDKEPLFDAFDTVQACLELAAPLVATAELNRQAIAASIDRGHLDATTLMEYLIVRGMPQRRAHELVGKLVRHSARLGQATGRVAAGRFSRRRPGLGRRRVSGVGSREIAEAFVSYGSTAPAQVEKQIAAWRQKLEV